MTARSRRRILAFRTVDEALLDGRACRQMMVRLHSEAPIGGPAYQAAGEVMDALDKLAEALTGDRTLWHIKPHGTGR